MKISNCCGENMDYEEIKVCPNCEEPCEIDEMEDEENATICLGGLILYG